MSDSHPKVRSGGFENWFAIAGECWAWPEGTREDWALLIAEMEKGAIACRADKRLAFTRRPDGRVFIYSPRNSTGSHDGVELGADQVPAFIASTRAAIA